jgi:hypothetical protein
MINLSERGFHLLMGGLLVGSTFLDRAMQAVTPAWNPPPVSLVTLAIGLIWVALFAGYRGRNLEQQQRALAARVERAEQQVARHDYELAQRRPDRL